jgi:hypothetical protein
MFFNYIYFQEYTYYYKLIYIKFFNNIQKLNWYWQKIFIITDEFITFNCELGNKSVYLKIIY